jgi:hypothetical protein
MPGEEIPEEHDDVESDERIADAAHADAHAEPFEDTAAGDENECKDGQEEESAAIEGNGEANPCR